MPIKNLCSVAGFALVGVAVAGATLASGSAVAADLGVWQKHEYSFAFMGFTSTYSCDGLASKLKLLLIAAGARSDAKANAGACADGDPGRALVAEIKGDDPRGSDGHPQHAEEAYRRKHRAQDSGGHGQSQGRPYGAFPVHDAGIMDRLKPALGRRLAGHILRQVLQLREPAGGAVAIVGLNCLVAAGAGNFHTLMSL